MHDLGDGSVQLLLTGQSNIEIARHEFEQVGWRIANMQPVGGDQHRVIVAPGDNVNQALGHLENCLSDGDPACAPIYRVVCSWLNNVPQPHRVRHSGFFKRAQAACAAYAKVLSASKPPTH